MIVAVLYYHSSIITIMTKKQTHCVSIYDKNKDQSGIGAKQVKNDIFFHQDWLFFCQKQLGKLFGTRMSVPLTSGCVRGADPDLRGFLPEVQECLSAMSETLLCPVFTSYPAEKGVFFKWSSLGRWLFLSHANISSILPDI